MAKEHLSEQKPLNRAAALIDLSRLLGLEHRATSLLITMSLLFLSALFPRTAKADDSFENVPWPTPLPSIIPVNPLPIGPVGLFVKELAEQNGPLNGKWSVPLSAPQTIEDTLPPNWIWRGGVSIVSSVKGMGGLSGLEIEHDLDNSLNILAISDSGKWIGGKLRQNAADGSYNQLVLTKPVDIPTRPGARRYQAQNNAEAIAIDPLGNILVAFEGDHRIQLHSTPTSSIPQVLTVPKDLKTAFRNGGIEALAALKYGQFFAVGEGIKKQNPSVAWVFDTQSENWPTLFYGKENDKDYAWNPTAAARMGEKLLLVERWWDRAFTFRTRLVSVNIADIKTGTILKPTVLFEMTPLVGIVGNIEGIAVIQSTSGYLVALITDNQEFSMLPTILVILEYLPNG